jgi:transposase
LAFEGLTASDIAERVGRSRRFVQRWCYAYRDRGLDGLEPKPQPGRPPMLPTTQHQAFKQRILDGPTEADGVCTLRGVDAQRILRDQFGVSYSLNGVYDLLHRLDLSVLVPRPEHRKSDPDAMKRWVEDAPFLSKK